MDEDAFVRRMNMSTKDHVEEERFHFKSEYAPLFQILRGRMKGFFEKQVAEKDGSPSCTFPAVDIGSGWAVGTAAMALTFRPPFLPEQAELIWYPSDWAGPKEGHPEQKKGGPVELRTRESLRYQIQEANELAPLLTDKAGTPVFRGDLIELNGLNAVQFNGRRGLIRGPDPKIDGRFKVQLSQDTNDCKSIKEENISYLGEPCLHDAMLHALRMSGEAEEFYEGLLERTREIDVLTPETWSNVKDLYGKCALVTCTSLLTCLGYRDPTAWKDTMRLASKLLCVDGYLLQYDTIGCASFGDTLFMREFADSESLGLVLDDEIIPPCSEHGSKKRKLVLWQKRN